MTVYLLVTSIDYEGGVVRGVYTNKEVAERQLKVITEESHGDWFNLVEVVVNVPLYVSLPYWE